MRELVNMAKNYGFIHPDGQDGEPVFSHQDQIFLRASELGCTPVYEWFAWRCHCPGAVHGISTAHTDISLRSLERAGEQ